MVVIWLLGSVIIWRLRRFHICATYAIAFVLLAILRAHLLHEPVLSEIAPVTSPEYQLFIFFMITDPKTTVKSRTGQILVVIAVAILEMFFRFGQSVYAELYALFWIGPIALLIEVWLNARRARINSVTSTLTSPPQTIRP
jgi:Na+-translocating ferredoxin:NAD+ oxidoreductase RnfD subunit